MASVAEADGKESQGVPGKWLLVPLGTRGDPRGGGAGADEASASGRALTRGAGALCSLAAVDREREDRPAPGMCRGLKHLLPKPSQIICVPKAIVAQVADW